MGSDLIVKSKETFERQQRRCVDKLSAEYLFGNIATISVGITATPSDGSRFAEGNLYRLTLVNGVVSVIDGVSAIGTVEDPPRSVVEQLSGPCVYLLVRATEVYELTRTVDLELTEQ